MAAFAVWLTGLPAAGKSTIARALGDELAARGIDAAILESDVIRPILMPHAGYNDADRDAFYRAFAYVGALLVGHGVPVVFDATANRRGYRARARAQIDRFLEVYVDCPLDVCMARDPKGLYREARSGGARNLPGLHAAYQPPEQPDLRIDSSCTSPEGAARAVTVALEARAFLEPSPSSQFGRSGSSV